jgi:hypothetical protein
MGPLRMFFVLRELYLNGYQEDGLEFAVRVGLALRGGYDQRMMTSSNVKSRNVTFEFQYIAQ